MTKLIFKFLLFFYWFFTPTIITNKQFYRYLGVHLFRLIPDFVGSKIMNRNIVGTYFISKPTRKNAKIFYKFTIMNEIIHWICLFLFPFYIVPFLLNIYCILLQRYHRVRLYKYIY